VIWLLSRVLADSDISGFINTLGRWAFVQWRLDAAETRSRSLGNWASHDYVETSAGAPAAALQNLGGARVILATAPDSKSISALVDRLSPNGKLLVVGIGSEPLSSSLGPLVGRRLSVQGWASGTAKDSEDTMRFSSLGGVRPMIEHYPLEKAAEGYEQMMSGRASSE
jgi:D-arabinose 1-dehydrogenase-like Zn-dependent alcohol dehydrogenase